MAELVPLQQAVSASGISRRTIQRLIADGRLKRYRKLGDPRAYIDLAQLRRLMEPRRT